MFEQIKEKCPAKRESSDVPNQIDCGLRDTRHNVYQQACCEKNCVLLHLSNVLLNNSQKNELK